MSGFASTRTGPASGGGLRGAVRAEWSKAWTVRSTWWCLLAGGVLMGLGAVQFSIFTTNANGNDDPADDKGVVEVGLIPMAALDLVQYALIGLAMLLITAEYAGGVIRTTLQWVPRRGVMLLAKTGVAAAAGGAAGVVLAVLGTAVAVPMLGRWGRFEMAGWLGDILAVGCYMALISVFALGLGAALRSGVGTLIAVFLLLAVLPAVLQASDVTVLERVADYLPGVAGASFMRGESEAYPSWAGLPILACWAAAAVGAGYAVLRRRDA
ncbi:hypothetical protein ACFY4C_09705 [Actinomadura viridis]|uniref:hypothetical protein n=1 Tax=Actinomadura viridis TaxID=58110 RepID=UPI00367A6E49